jgi:hypothetical protein
MCTTNCLIYISYHSALRRFATAADAPGGRGSKRQKQALAALSSSDSGCAPQGAGGGGGAGAAATGGWWGELTHELWGKYAKCYVSSCRERSLTSAPGN